jgi:hypothetical protein
MPARSAMPAMNWPSIESSSAVGLLAVVLAHLLADEAVGRALVAAGLRDLHGHAELVPEPAVEEVLLREAEDRRAAAGRDVELLGRARDVVLEVRAERLDLEERDRMAALVAQRADRVAQLLGLRPSRPGGCATVRITCVMRSSRSALRSSESTPRSGRPLEAEQIAPIVGASGAST